MLHVSVPEKHQRMFRGNKTGRPYAKAGICQEQMRKRVKTLGKVRSFVSAIFDRPRGRTLTIYL